MGNELSRDGMDETLPSSSHPRPNPTEVKHGNLYASSPNPSGRALKIEHRPSSSPIPNEVHKNGSSKTTSTTTTTNVKRKGVAPTADIILAPSPADLELLKQLRNAYSTSTPPSTTASRATERPHSQKQMTPLTSSNNSPLTGKTEGVESHCNTTPTGNGLGLPTLNNLKLEDYLDCIVDSSSSSANSSIKTSSSSHLPSLCIRPDALPVRDDTPSHLSDPPTPTTSLPTVPPLSDASPISLTTTTSESRQDRQSQSHPHSELHSHSHIHLEAQNQSQIDSQTIRGRTRSRSSSRGTRFVGRSRSTSAASKGKGEEQTDAHSKDVDPKRYTQADTYIPNNTNNHNHSNSNSTDDKSNNNNSSSNTSNNHSITIPHHDLHDDEPIVGSGAAFEEDVWADLIDFVLPFVPDDLTLLWEPNQVSVLILAIPRDRRFIAKLEDRAVKRKMRKFIGLIEKEKRAKSQQQAMSSSLGSWGLLNLIGGGGGGGGGGNNNPPKIGNGTNSNSSSGSHDYSTSPHHLDQQRQSLNNADSTDSDMSILSSRPSRSFSSSSMDEGTLPLGGRRSQRSSSVHGAHLISPKDLDSYPLSLTQQLLSIDPHLAALRHAWVPASVTDDEFWQEYYCEAINRVLKFVCQAE